MFIEEPLSTIISWVIGICAVIFIPFLVITFIVVISKFFKDYFKDS